MGGRVTSLYMDLFHRLKIGGTNQIAVFKRSKLVNMRWPLQLAAALAAALT